MPPATSLTLRRALTADAGAAGALLRDLGYEDLDPAAFGRAFAAVLTDPQQQVWLAVDGDRPVGLMSLSTRPQLRLAGPIMTVDELVVTPATRGTGVGAALLGVAKSEAVRIGARRLELLTRRGRPSYTRGFYVKNGFTEVDSAVMRWNPDTGH